MDMGRENEAMVRPSFPYGYTTWRQVLWHCVAAVLLIVALALTR